MWQIFFSKKKIIIYIIILGVGGFAVSRLFGNNGASDILTDTVKRQDLKRTVLATGQIVSNTDLDLSFKSSGRVSRVNVKVGDKVRSGAILAALDQGAELAAVKSAQGALASAQANYKKVLEGASNEEIAVSIAAVHAAEVALTNAKQSLDDTIIKQDVLVANAFRALMNTSLSAKVISLYDGNLTATITGIYFGQAEGQINVMLAPSGNVNFYYQASGLVSYTGLAERGKALPLGDSGLFITFGTSGTITLSDSWVVEIPNKQSVSYVTNYNAYQAALNTRTTAIAEAIAAVASAEATLAQRQADLALKQAAALPSELEAARADVLSAEGQLQSAQSALENTIIRAPAAGTITKVDTKLGELASALATVIVLQDVDNLYIEANISEANIAGIKAGQRVDVAFDALGEDKTYQATVQFVDPASTIVSGVVNYQIKAAIAKTEEILSGMTADMTVIIEDKEGVLVVPARAVIARDGKSFVRVITDAKTKAFAEQEIVLGFTGDGGLVEVLRGLDEGREIVTDILVK